MPVAPDTADPMLIFVTEVEIPPVPMFIVFVVAAAVAFPNKVAVNVPVGVPPRVKVVSAAPCVIVVGVANKVVDADELSKLVVNVGLASGA